MHLISIVKLIKTIEIEPIFYLKKQSSVLFNGNVNCE